MPTTLVDLQALDPAVLTPILRKAEGVDDLHVHAFTAEPLKHQGIFNPDGLFLVQGTLQAPYAQRRWSLVLKILREPEEHQEPHDLFYWRREALAAESELLIRLPGSLTAVRYIALTEAPGEAWIWMERVVETTGRQWTMDHFALVAGGIGELNGPYLTGTPLPASPWLLRDLARQWTETLPPANAWTDPYVQAHFSALLQQRVMHLWSERTRFYAALAALPQVFSHFDLQRRNVMIRGDEIVALDWAWCGIGPVGGDLYSLIGSSCLLGEWDIARVIELEEATFTAYLGGLRRSGWNGDSRLVRLGYTAWMAVYFGLTCPTLVAYWMVPERQADAGHLFGAGPDELSISWATLCNHALDLADEARDMMRELGLNP